MTTVLLIADDDRVRNDVEAALAGPRSEVITVADPHEAVSSAMTAEPEAVLVDLRVGSMGGMALVRSLRDAIARGDLASTPLIMLLDRSADEFLAGRAGADAWIVKPFPAQALRSVLSAEASTAS